MYEAMLNRVRIFPPLAYGLSNFINGTASKEEVENVFLGYMEALKELKKEEKINFSDGYVTVSKQFIAESKKPKARLANISKNAPRTLFTSVLSTLPQLLNFFSKNTEALMKLKKFTVKRELDLARRFVNPQKYVFAPTAKGLISLADRLDIETYAQKMLLKNKKGKITFNPIGGVLNDVYSINVHSDNTEKKVIVKRFKDWSGFKWFPLSIWSFGTRNFAVLGRTRLEKEVSIGEFLRGKGIAVPKILHVSHSKRLVFMEFIDGENLANAIKRIATTKDGKNQKDLERIEKAGEIFAQVHAFHVTLGDTKPENVLFNSDNNPYLLDFEQASYDGDRAWDVAVFLYYAGHYLQPLHSNGKAESITKAFVKGYLKGGGEVSAIKKAGNSKYTRIFSVFTMPSVISVISNICKKIGKQR
jgi:tRNA A-37 threonylcarbamoyl transferase component Bud32